MPLSERERKVLEQLEREFVSSSAGSPDVTSSSKAIPSLWLVVLAALGIPAGLLLVLVGVTVANTVGICLAVVAYIVIVASSSVLYGRVSRSRSVLARTARLRANSQPPRPGR